MTWSFPRREAPPDAWPQEATPGADEDEGREGKGEGTGAAQFRPDEALFNPSLAREKSQALLDPQSAPGQGDSARTVEQFGLWEFDVQTIELFHRQRNRKLMLAQLDSSTKIMKVLVALGTQTQGDVGWDVGGLLQALDRAARLKFSKSLYQLASSLQDSTTLDWKAGQISEDKSLASSLRSEASVSVNPSKKSFEKTVEKEATPCQPKASVDKHARTKSSKQTS